MISSSDRVSPSRYLSRRSSSASAIFSTRASLSFSTSSCISEGISPCVAFPSALYVYAFILIRSTTPLKSASVPIGSCNMIGFGLKHSAASLKVRKKSARSLSILFIKIMQGRLNSSAKSHAISVCTLTPSTASIRTTIPSAACMQLLVSEKKF